MGAVSPSASMLSVNSRKSVSATVPHRFGRAGTTVRLRWGMFGISPSRDRTNSSAAAPAACLWRTGGGMGNRCLKNFERGNPQNNSGPRNTNYRTQRTPR